MLLLDGEAGRDASAAELGGRTGELAAWVAGLRSQGVVRGGGHVDGPVLRVTTGDGRMTAVDVAPDEGIHSWLLIDTTDLGAALSMARSCPEAAHGEVRVLAVDPEGRVP